MTRPYSMIFVCGHWLGWRRGRRSALWRRRWRSARLAFPNGAPLSGDGHVSPGKIGGYKKRVLSGAKADWLRTRMRASAFTLRGLAAELAAARG